MPDAYEPSAEDIQAFVDGELSSEAAERVRVAIARSERAAAELEECLQVKALAEAMREEAVAADPPPPRAPGTVAPPLL
jgi:anti-sigma factor RsiW